MTYYHKMYWSLSISIYSGKCLIKSDIQNLTSARVVRLTVRRD